MVLLMKWQRFRSRCRVGTRCSSWSPAMHLQGERRSGCPQQIASMSFTMVSPSQRITQKGVHIDLLKAQQRELWFCSTWAISIYCSFQPHKCERNFWTTFESLWPRPWKSLSSHFLVSLNFWGFRGLCSHARVSTSGINCCSHAFRASEEPQPSSTPSPSSVTPSVLLWISWPALVGQWSNSQVSIQSWRWDHPKLLRKFPSFSQNNFLSGGYPNHSTSVFLRFLIISGSFARGRCRRGRSEIPHFCSKLLLSALVL